VALAWLAAAAPARADDVKLAILGVEAEHVAPAVAQRLTDALRARAAATPGAQLVEGKDLVELRMIFNCDREAPDCLSKAGRSLGADLVVYGFVHPGKRLKKGRRGKGKPIAVSLHTLDVKLNAFKSSVSDTVASDQLAAGATRWFPQLVRIDARPTLTVQSTPPAAMVSIDGQGVGRTPFTTRELSPGKHAINLFLDGRVTVTREVELTAARASEVSATLPPLPPPPRARLVLIHRNEMSALFAPLRYVYKLDGVEIAHAADATKMAQRELELFNQEIPLGPHVLSVQLVYQGQGLPYMRAYRFTVRSTHAFEAAKDAQIILRVIGYEKGSPLTTEPRDRPAIRFGARVVDEAGEAHSDGVAPVDLGVPVDAARVR
jgi:hypothetical protein